MSKCSPFTFNFNGPASNVVNMAQQEVTSHGGNFSGNTNSGNFSLSSPVTIAGNYTINGQVLTVTITEEPFLLPCVAIRDYIQGQLNTLSVASV